jgi:hypothetical protein
MAYWINDGVLKETKSSVLAVLSNAQDEVSDANKLIRHPDDPNRRSHKSKEVKINKAYEELAKELNNIATNLRSKIHYSEH